jgi:YesN/AraC family two-component response regulator
MVGYENAFYFSRLFRKQKGLSPAAYRKIFREKYQEHL